MHRVDPPGIRRGRGARSVTTYHTFDGDGIPPPSDIELEIADRRNRERWAWLREAIIEAEDARDQRNTQQDALGVLF